MELIRERRIGLAYSLVKEYLDEVAERIVIESQMRHLELIGNGDVLENDYPVYLVGAALRIANKYGITFDIGTRMGDCRAILPRSRWLKPIDRTVPLESLAFFTIPKSYDDIEDFQGMSDKIEIAICRCLIAARTAGVI